MKTVILAGGMGTRLAEETSIKPKPMVEIGGKPILWHIMNVYASHGYADFVVACGYLGEIIKEYFASFHLRNDDFFVSLRTGEVEKSDVRSPDWRVGCVDTGPDTMTGGRLLALADHLGGETFMATYGDGLADVDISRLVAFHRDHGRLATVLAVHPPPRFGSMVLQDDRVFEFSEKHPAEGGWINGGFFVFEPQVLDHIDGPHTRLEAEPLSRLAEEGQLMAYRHEGFWKPMDTLREKQELEELWTSGKAPWKTW